MNEIGRRVNDLKAQLTANLDGRVTANTQAQAQSTEADARFEEFCTKQDAELKEKLQRLNVEIEAQRKRLENKWKNRPNRVEKARARVKAVLRDQALARVEELEKQKSLSYGQFIAEYEKKIAALKAECDQSLAETAPVQEAAEQLRQRISAFADENKLHLSSSSAPALPDDPDAAAPDKAAFERRIAETEQGFDGVRRKAERRLPPAAAYVIVILLFAGAAAYLYTLAPASPYPLFAVPALVLALGAVFSIYAALKAKSRLATAKLLQDAQLTCALIQRRRQPLDQRWTDESAAMDKERTARLCAITEDCDRQILETRRMSAELETLNERYSALKLRVGRGIQMQRERFRKEAAERPAALQAQYAAQRAEAAQRLTDRKAQLATQQTDTIARLTSEWDSALAGLAAYGKESRERWRQKHPPWAEISPEGWKGGAEFPKEVYLGEMRLSLANFIPDTTADHALAISKAAPLELPVFLTFPLHGCLYLRASSRKRDEALKLLFNAVLRLLCTFPPAKAKFTVIDPVGLGQNFSALMHLTDYDESLVSGKIWSDGAHIERKLSELTEHMETVIQKYLRNRYVSIDEYNQQAGQLAEPYRFLVLADFPTGVSELALERLASIIASGARCGVYTLIYHDARMKLPANVVEAQLRRNGLMIKEHDGELIIDDEATSRAVFQSEAAPEGKLADALINAVGRQCGEAARVQVPFEAAVPPKERYWSSDSTKGLEVPLGKSGATRLQSLQLGRDTAQHALIAGKTGSGKSNLFHIIVTNAALWYSPRELEFYLVDFKKGVEFKTYAQYQLPHAHVIAVESDREFGLSVLQRIDRELTHRGELFRHARVQDFPSFRKCAGVVHLPRTLLVIDEFQEFFTDDDEVAQDAALLLDRIVRQGRAFGVHVVLGSQTLGGTYTLAKSTLGQMAVRIALQCNEADSYMILSDDNAAASLLSRPGEAIYNDMAGLVEGNNPFQIVYLNRDIQNAYLAEVQRKAAAEGAMPEAPPCVFEGNQAVDLGNNHLLRARPAPVLKTQETRARVWLGEANAIKGPTEVEFAPQAGSNLLVVGQRGGAELAMCAASILSLAATSPSGKARVVLLDGSAPDSGAHALFEFMAQKLPLQLELCDHRHVAEVIPALAKIVRERRDEHADTSPVYLLVLGLERFRTLRQDDDFGPPGGDAGEVSAAAAFGEILSEGSRERVHVLTWCDTLNNLNRTLSRKTLREFEMRVLFQMSANDSSELIDSPAANRLGLYNALLFTLQNGAIEKFRPYGLADRELITQLSQGWTAKATATATATADERG